MLILILAILAFAPERPRGILKTRKSNLKDSPKRVKWKDEQGLIRRLISRYLRIDTLERTNRIPSRKSIEKYTDELWWSRRHTARNKAHTLEHRLFMPSVKETQNTEWFEPYKLAGDPIQPKEEK